MPASSPASRSWRRRWTGSTPSIRLSTRSSRGVRREDCLAEARREGFRPRRWRPVRPAARGQGSRGGQGHAHDDGLAAARAVSPKRGFGLRRAASRGGRDLHRQDQHARIRPRLPDLQSRPWRDPQRLRSRAHSRRLERRRDGRACAENARARRRLRLRRQPAQPRGMERRLRTCAPRSAAFRTTGAKSGSPP